MPPVIDKQALFDFDQVFDVDDYLYFYSQSLTDERSDEEVAALVQLLRLDQPLEILDLACGFGRHANRLAALGHHITGIDRSPGFLELARKDALQRGVHVTYRQADMRSIATDTAFDCVLLLFTAFGYFDDQGNDLVLAQAARALKPGGRFCFDIPNRDGFLRSMVPAIVTDLEGNLMIDRMSFDSLTGRWQNQRIVIRDGIRRDKPFSIRLYNPCEIRDALVRAGFEVEAIYGGWQGEPVSTESRRMVIIARRPAAGAASSGQP